MVGSDSLLQGSIDTVVTMEYAKQCGACGPERFEFPDGIDARERQ